MEKQSSSSVKDIINSSLEQIRTIVDANTVVGKQIVTPSGTVIVPISRVSMGFASGGLDVPSNKGQTKNFGAGGGTGVSVVPIGFLVISASGAVEMLPLTQEKADPIEQIAGILEQAPDILNRIKSVFSEELADQTAEEAADLEAEYAARLRDLEEEKAKRKKRK